MKYVFTLFKFSVIFQAASFLMMNQNTPVSFGEYAQYLNPKYSIQNTLIQSRDNLMLVARKIEYVNNRR